jgi:hypothetical protein
MSYIFCKKHGETGSTHVIFNWGDGNHKVDQEIDLCPGCIFDHVSEITKSWPQTEEIKHTEIRFGIKFTDSE